MRARGIWITVAIVVLTIVYLVSSEFIDHQMKHSSTTTFNQGPTGASLLYQFLQELGPNRGVVKKSAFFNKKELEGVGAIFIFSPKTHLSAREGTILREYVEAGGNIVIAIHNSESQSKVQSFLSAAEIPPLVENSSFEDKKANVARPTKDSLFFSKEEDYAFYGRLIFKDDDCRNSSFECFVQEVALGTGFVVVVSSLSPLSNALIQRANNVRMAYRFLEFGRTIMIDEYHHFFSDRTMLDLFLEPLFIIPLVGILLTLMLYFFLGGREMRGSHEHEIPNARFKDAVAVKGRQTFHELNASILKKRVFDSTQGYTSTLNYVAAQLGRIFPKEMNQQRTKLPSLAAKDHKEFLSEFLKLLRTHRSVLHQRGLEVENPKAKTMHHKGRVAP